MEAHDAVAGFPIETHGNCGDAFGGILHQRDLFGLGAHQAGGSGADAVVSGQPLRVV